MNIKKIVHWLSDGIPGSGLFKELLTQQNNRSTNIKIRTAYTGITSGGSFKGSWSSGGTWVAGDIINYPTSSPLYWRANNSVGAGEATPDLNSKWDIEVGMDMIQDSGDGVNFFRYTLGFRNDDFIRIQNLQYGTLGVSSFSNGDVNYDGNGVAIITTSTTSNSVPSSHPSSRTFTVGTGLTIPNSTTIGSSSDSFAIPTTIGTIISQTISTGLSLTKGDVVVFYGNASNFIITVCARYNSITGAFYGASLHNIGSGTFASWTVKTEKILYVYRTADEPGVNWYGLVQTYDSGTGSLTLNSFANTNTTTHSDWTFALGLVPGDPTTTLSNSFNRTLKPTGVFIKGSFRGTRLQHLSTKDNRGTGWKYIYCNGPDISNPPADITIDTYNATLLTLQSTNVWANLSEGLHEILAVSVTSPSGSSSNTRAWTNSDTDTAGNRTWDQRFDYDTFTSAVDFNLLNSESNGEFAYNYRDTDAGDALRWLPEHSNVKTCIGRAGRVFTINGSIFDHTKKSLSSGQVNTHLYKYQAFTTARLAQSLTATHPQASGDMGTVVSAHSFDRNGLKYEVTIDMSQSGFISVGYNNMVSLGESFFQKLKTGGGEYINRPSDNTTVNLTASQIGLPDYIFYSTSVSSPLKDLAMAIFMENAEDAWRTGLPDTGTSFIQDFSGTTGAKFYPTAYSSHNFTSSFLQRIITRIYIGNFIDANNNI